MAGRRILSKHMTLGELQKKILECGPEYFNNGNMNLVSYARTLILILSYDEVRISFNQKFVKTKRRETRNKSYKTYSY